MHRYLDEGQTVILVHSALPLLPGLITLGTNDAPDFDIPTVGEEVGMEAPVKRQARFIDVRDSMIEEPVVNSKFVGRADLVTVPSDQPFTTIPTIGTTYDTNLFTQAGNGVVGDPVPCGKGREGYALFVEGAQFIGAGQHRHGGATTTLPDVWSRNAVGAKPMLDSRVVNAVAGCNFTVGTMFLMNEPMEIITSRRSDSTIGKTAAGWATLDLVATQPTFHGCMTNAKLLCNGVRREPLAPVKIAKLAGSRFHRHIIRGIGNSVKPAFEAAMKALFD